MSGTTERDVRVDVRNHYAARVAEGGSCCGGASSDGDGQCCATGDPLTPVDTGAAIEKTDRLGYSADDRAAVPEAAAMSLGCGNPQAIANLRSGEVVVDLGSGAGFDCFLAARAVGPEGRAIGVDMTPEMIARARATASSRGFPNVEFRLGEIEHLPVADASVDVVISNCVVNLSPDKAAVYGEAFRVLKPGGRIAIADTVATAPVPEDASRDMELWSACASGSLEIGELDRILTTVGFTDIRIAPKDESRQMIREWNPGTDIHEYIVSANIEAVKPR